LGLARFNEPTTSPVVGVRVRVPSALETEETAPPPTQLRPTAKHPEVRVIPWAKVEVAVPVISSLSPLKFPSVLRLEEKEDVAVVPPPAEIVLEAERCPVTLRFLWKVEEAVEIRPAKLASPVPVMTSAVISEDPMEMFPKPEPREPDVRAPTPVREELRIPAPRVAASRTRVSFMRNTPPVGRLKFPEARVSPPEKVEVALSPTIVVLAAPPT
jgi:hypothetical protein